jgi:predicted alpha/beta-hydrolase family hydrolase
METLVVLPGDARALYVLAHGAGAGMRHEFLEAIAGALAVRRVGTLRFEFPYMAEGRRAPDKPAVCEASVREAVAEAARVAPGLPLVAGGKSFGGRMTSQAQASAPLRGVRGLVFLGFPLHPPDKPGVERARHLGDVRIPMLFLQGTRDAFARRTLLLPLLSRLPRATLLDVDGADHGFAVRGRPAAAVIEELAAAIVAFTLRFRRRKRSTS